MPKTKQIQVSVKSLVNCYEGESCHISYMAGFNIDENKIEAVKLEGDTLTIKVTEEP